MWYWDTRLSLIDDGSPTNVKTFELWSKNMVQKYYGGKTNWTNLPMRGRDRVFEKYVRPKLTKKDIDALVDMLN